MEVETLFKNMHEVSRRREKEEFEKVEQTLVGIHKIWAYHFRRNLPYEAQYLHERRKYFSSLYPLHYTPELPAPFLHVRTNPEILDGMNYAYVTGS